MYLGASLGARVWFLGGHWLLGRHEDAETGGRDGETETGSEG
jgi:hypothetical protein